MIGIIGGGITGLTAAYALRKQGFDVHLLEERDRPGGVVNSERRDGFLVENGPQSLMDKNPRIGEMLTDLGLEGERVKASETARKRYIVKDGELVDLPSSPGSLITNKAFSLKAKGRILLEPLVRRYQGDSEETVAGFFERRLGREILDYAVSPFVSGIFAGRPHALSMRHAFPGLHALEQEHGSILKGQIKQRRQSKGQGSGKGKGGMFSFREGLGTLPKTLANFLSESISLNARVRELKREDGNWNVTWTEGGETKSMTFERLIMTAPAYRLPGIQFSSRENSQFEELRRFPYSPVSVLALGFRRKAVDHPLDGFGFLVPEVESLPVLGVSFSSSIFPNRAPEDHVLLSVYIGGARSPDLAGRPRDELLRLVQPALRRTLGIYEPPVFTHHTYWPKGIPQYNLGHDRYLDSFSAIETENPGLYLSGNYRGGISLGECIASGFAVAERVVVDGK